MHARILYEHVAGHCGYLLGICREFYSIELNIILLMHITNQHTEVTYKSYWQLGLENLNHIGTFLSDVYDTQ